MKSAESKTTTTSHLPQVQKAIQPFFSRKDGDGAFFSKAPRADYVSNVSDGNIIQRDDESSTTTVAPAPVVTNADRAQHIATALSQTSPAFTSEPGTILPNGGAFHILRPLNSNDLIDTISNISVPNRQLIFDNLNLETDFYQKARFKTAIKSISWGQSAEGVERLNLLHSLYQAALREIIEFFNSFFGGNLSGISDGILTGVFTNMQGMTKEEIITLMQTLDETFVQYLHSKLHLAPAGDRNRISNLMNDFLGATRMEADDYIDVTNLTGLARRMAMIYNTKGQYIASQARTFGVDSGVLAGFITIESGARAFDGGTDRPLIRFENHVFWRRWGQHNPVQFNQHFQYNTTGDVWTGHLYRVNNTSPWQTFHGNQTREWEAVNIATRLSDQETAYLCMSMGMGQIMGFNFANAGFANAVEMFDAFNQNESSQIDGMLSFINNNANLLTAVQNRNFTNIARYYNGSGQMGVYGPRIQSATQAYDNVTAGRLHIVP